MLIPHSSPPLVSRAARHAFEKALESYKKSLSKKDFAAITMPTSASDVVATVKDIESQFDSRKSLRILEKIYPNVQRMERFGELLDSVLQFDVTSAGCLVWGSIRYVLMVVRQHAEQYRKLRDVFVQIAEYLPQLDLFADTFEGSPLVTGAVESVFVSTLKFWVTATKFYRRKRLCM